MKLALWATISSPQAGNMEELRAMVRDAVRCHFDDGSAPAIIRLHIVNDEVIPV